MDDKVKPSADNIAATARAASRRGPPPVDQWNPPYCGDLDIRIARDGTWFYLGTPIGRMPLVKLFASILKLEDGKYFLVTPVEKVGIKVDDAPLLAVDFDVEGVGKDQTLRFVTKTEDEVEAGEGHDIRVEQDPDTGEPGPYIHIRRGLWALIDRKSFYRLVDLCRHETLDGQSWFGLWSRGRFYPVIASKELN